jgi:hypothetical protein
MLTNGDRPESMSFSETSTIGASDLAAGGTCSVDCIHATQDQLFLTPPELRASLVGC